MNFYNDNDKNACAWLRELIRAGLIPNGMVDSRSIADIQPADLEKVMGLTVTADIRAGTVITWKDLK